MEDLLKQIAKNTAHKTSFQIIVSDNKSSFNTRISQAIQLDRDKEYEIALVNLETGFLSIIGKYSVKMSTSKAEKHENIKMIASTKLDTISSHISKALSDN